MGEMYPKIVHHDSAIITLNFGENRAKGSKSVNVGGETAVREPWGGHPGPGSAPGRRNRVKRAKTGKKIKIKRTRQKGGKWEKSVRK